MHGTAPRSRSRSAIRRNRSRGVHGFSDPRCPGSRPGGVRTAAESRDPSPCERMTVVDGSPLSKTEPGGTSIGVGADCAVSGPLRVGPEVEWSWAPPLSLTHLVGSARIDLLGLVRDREPSNGIRLSVEGSVGWTFTGVSCGGACLLVLPGNAIVFDPGDSGPVLGAGLRMGVPVFGDFRFFVDGSWRTTFLTETEFGEAPGEPSTVAFDVLPVTAGVSLRL